MNNLRKEELESLLLKFTKFLEPYKHLLNSHNVQYLIDDHWNQVFTDNELKDDLNVLIDHKLTLLEYFDSFSETRKPFTLKVLDKFLQDLKDLHENWIKLVITRKENIITEELDAQLNEVEELRRKNEKLKYSDRFMTAKKSHEVDELSHLIAKLCKSLSINKVIDIGAGKGYLSAQLSYLYNFKVFAIDSNNTCLNGSEKRLEKMKKQTNLGIDVSKEVNNLNLIVDQNTNLGDLLNLDDLNYSLCGLHSCGNLSNHIINLYLHNKQFNSNQKSLLCFVSCCYHLINEKYLPPEWDYIKYDDDNELHKLNEEENSIKTFPMSFLLNKKNYFLGRNMRMLSAQPIEKLLNNNQVNDRGLWFRSLLQIMLKEKFKLEGIHLKTGKIAAKCENFNVYVRKAISKLKLDNLLITDAEINEYWEKYTNERIKFYYYFQFKILFAPLIEYIILLDRLIFLYEKSNKDTNNFLVKLFDPIISPRCYCLISF